MNNSVKYRLKAADITARFGRQTLFKNIDIELNTGDSCAITGHNGSGKSTLLKILAQLMIPWSGSVDLYSNGIKLDPFQSMEHTGFTSPLVNPYRELTGQENIDFTAKGNAIQRNTGLLELFSLTQHSAKEVRNYSTGMIQRLKYILAVINDPPLLFLDEPGSNLDSHGKDAMYNHIESLKNNKIIIIATNDRIEAEICSMELPLGT